MDKYIRPEFENLIENGYNFDLNAYFKLAWHNFKQAPIQYVAYFIIYSLTILILSLIPLINIINGLLSPVLVIGFAIVAQKIQKNRAIEFSDFFGGFNKNPGHLILVSILTSLLIFAVCIPAIILLFSFVPDFENSENFTGWYIIILGLPILLTFACIVYLTIGWSWASYLVAFKNYKPWPAMELSRKLIHENWFSFLGFYILIGFLNLIGVMSFLIGLIITAPLSYIALYIAFEQIIHTNDFDEIASIGQGIEHEGQDNEGF